MRRLAFSAAVLLAALVAGDRANAQFLDPSSSNFNPFNLYYGWFLPQQAALAARPTAGTTISALSAARQQTAMTSRASLYDPVASYRSYDPNDPFPDRSRAARMSAYPSQSSNINGTGPGAYYNRAGQYYSGIRAGRGPNANVSVSFPTNRTGVPGLNPYNFAPPR